MGGRPQGGTLSASRAESAAMGRIQRVLEHGGDSDLHVRDPQEEPGRSVGLYWLCVTLLEAVNWKKLYLFVAVNSSGVRHSKRCWE